jgi:hypothetical protein
MSDVDNVAAGEIVPSDSEGTGATETVAAQPQVSNQEEPKWLNQRIEQAKRSATAALLKELGVNDPVALKALVERGKQAEDAGKSEIERLTEKLMQTQAQAQRAAALEEVLSAHASQELEKLSENERAFLLEVAGGDPVKQLALVSKYRTTIAARPQQAPTQPASTTAVAATPAEATSPVRNLRAEYEALKAKNPIKAAAFQLKHAKELQQ